MICQCGYSGEPIRIIGQNYVSDGENMLSVDTLACPDCANMTLDIDKLVSDEDAL